MLIEINNCKCPINTKVKNENCWIRIATKEKIKDLVFNKAIKLEKIKNKGVDIRLVAHYRDLRPSHHNLFVNPIISGLIKAKLFQDEDISSISLAALSKMPSNKILIYINE